MPGSLTNRNFGFGTIGRVILAGGRITHRLARHVLNGKPGRKQQGKINDPEDDHEKDREAQCKFHRGLGFVFAAQKAVGGEG
jgi:hypothetical protein